MKRSGQASTRLSGIGSVTAAVTSDGIVPMHATTQPAADGGQGIPSQDGQCWLQSALIVACR